MLTVSLPPSTHTRDATDITHIEQVHTRHTGPGQKVRAGGVNDDKFRCEDSKMSQNGGHHAIRRRKLPLESDLPTFFGDPNFFSRYVGYVSYQSSYIINEIKLND